MLRSPKHLEATVPSLTEENEETSSQAGKTVGRTEIVRAQRSGSVPPKSLGKRPHKLDPALKSWLDNVIIPALVREYLAEIEKQNRLATNGGSEVTSE